MPLAAWASRFPLNRVFAEDFRDSSGNKMVTVKNDRPHRNDEKWQAPKFRNHSFISHECIKYVHYNTRRIKLWRFMLDTTMSVPCQVRTFLVCCVCTLLGHSAVSLELMCLHRCLPLIWRHLLGYLQRLNCNLCCLNVNVYYFYLFIYYFIIQYIHNVL